MFFIIFETKREYIVLYQLRKTNKSINIFFIKQILLLKLY